MTKITKIYAAVCQKHGADIKAKKVRQILALEMIEKALQTFNSRAIPYQICPVCDGKGQITSEVNKTTSLMNTCETCGGTKVIPMYLPPINKKCYLFTSADTSGFCDNCGKRYIDH